jgi:hypothetical protein
MYSVLLKCDMLGHKPELFYNSESRYKTIFGSLLSITIGFLSILAFIGFGFNLLVRKNPTGVYNKELNENMNVPVKDLFFLFAPHLPRGLQLTEFNRKFSISARYINTDVISENRSTNKTIQQSITMVKCSETDRYKTNYLNVTSFMTLTQTDYWCLPDDFTDTINGQQGTSQFAFLSVVINFCDSTAANNTCYSVSEVQSLHPKIVLQIITLDHYIDPKQYDNPITPLFNLDLNLVDTKAQRSDFIWLKNTEVITDAGWIMESPSMERTFQIGSKQFTYAPLSTNTIAQMDIAMDSLKDVYYRKYLKLQDVIASAGGFIKMIMLVSQFIIDFLNSQLVYQSLYLNILNKYISKTAGGGARTKQSDVVIYRKHDLSVSNTELNVIPNENVFVERKASYKRLGISDIICACRKRKQNITSLLMNDIKKHLGVENMIVQSKVISKANKLIWGASGYKLLKYISMKEYLYGLSRAKAPGRKYNLEALVKDVGSKREIDAHEILRRELKLPLLSEIR